MATEVLCRKLLDRSGFSTWSLTSYRKLTSGEVATALRPFYFSVHPDLFGKFPSERATNENSLQILSSYLQTLQQNRPPRPANLKFFLRPQQTGPLTGNSLKPVNIKLIQRDIRKTVVSILSTCDLPTTYVDNIAPEPEQIKITDIDAAFRNRFYQYENSWNPNLDKEMQENVKQTKTENLLSWVSKNVDSAKEKLAACEPIREEVVKLQKSLCQNFGLKDVLWDCSWNIAHFRGCLHAFQALAEHHQDAMTVLKGRTLVFGNDTGLSLDGHILLNSGEFIKNVWKQDTALKKLPQFEKALSIVLRDIQVVRRKFQPKTMVEQYQNNLRRLTTSLSDCQGRGGYPKHWPNNLSEYELVVETEAGPLMVSPTGQFIVPCSCPSFLIVNFISENLDKATESLKQYKGQKQVEKDLHKKCLEELGLIALDKDDCITPDPMITCCTNLLQHSSQLRTHFEGTRLTITNYYSVMSDGQMCIPWNWKSVT